MYSSKMRPRPKTMHTILESYYFLGKDVVWVNLRVKDLLRSNFNISDQQVADLCKMFCVFLV